MKLVFLGPPGAGKGTQAEETCKSFSLTHISTGDILRKAVADGSDVGLEAKKYMEEGDLVPDSIIVGLAADRMSEDDCAEGFILDGFPRTIVQAQALDEELQNSGSRLDLVIYFETSEDVIIRRLTGRRICRKCGANYHIETMKPRVEGVCDRCGGEIYQRSDDKLGTIKKRVKVYHEETDSLIEYYRERDILAEVDGDEAVSELAVVLEGMLSVR